MSENGNFVPPRRRCDHTWRYDPSRFYFTASIFGHTPFYAKLSNCFFFKKTIISWIGKVRS